MISPIGLKSVGETMTTTMMIEREEGANRLPLFLMPEGNISIELFNRAFVIGQPRSGKGTNTVVPSLYTWKKSMFCLDKDMDLWRLTARYRKETLGQNVFKFAPLCTDSSSAHWNPLAEIRFRTPMEFQDVSMLSDIIMSSNSSRSEYGPYDSFWDKASSIFIKSVILHLLYSHQMEEKQFPSMGDVVNFLMNPDLSSEDLCDLMLSYSHISPEEFLSDHNFLYETYGEYIKDWTEINDSLSNFRLGPVSSIPEAQQAIREYLKRHDDVHFPSGDAFRLLLTHPKVAECVGYLKKCPYQTAQSILSTILQI